MATHWFLHEDHNKFRNAVKAIIDKAASNLRRPDARATLGDEHDQCQYLFTNIYTVMQEREADLTEAVLCCSKIPDPVVELRYYRSRVKRSGEQPKAQFVEGETGADFALVLNVSFPNVLQAQRSILGQAKILDRASTQINSDQLKQILRVGGPESAVYLLWGGDQPPTVVSAENVDAFTRTQGRSNLNGRILPFGQPLSEFFSEAFLGLWFGKDYDPVREKENPPATSIAVLYHFLHRMVPPPNVVYLGVMSAQQSGLRPGVYVNDIQDL